MVKLRLKVSTTSKEMLVAIESYHSYRSDDTTLIIFASILGNFLLVYKGYPCLGNSKRYVVSLLILVLHHSFVWVFITKYLFFIDYDNNERVIKEWSLKCFCTCSLPVLLNQSIHTYLLVQKITVIVRQNSNFSRSMRMSQGQKSLLFSDSLVHNASIH